jgi:hypothetical protein
MLWYEDLMLISLIIAWFWHENEMIWPSIYYYSSLRCHCQRICNKIFVNLNFNSYRRGTLTLKWGSHVSQTFSKFQHAITLLQCVVWHWYFKCRFLVPWPLFRYITWLSNFTYIHAMQCNLCKFLSKNYSKIINHIESTF